MRTHPTAFHPRTWLIALVLLGLLSAGCATIPDPESSQDYTADIIARVDAGQSWGQTFASRREGLRSILVWMQPGSETGGEGVLVATLYALAPAQTHNLERETLGEPLARISVPLSTLAEHYPFSVTLPEIPPASPAYYLEFSASRGPLLVYGRDEDQYPAGAAYLDGSSLAGDMAFQPAYELTPRSLLALLRQTNPLILVKLALLMLVLVLPGRLLLLLFKQQPGDFGQRLAFSVALSLAFYPVLMTWTSLFHLRWRGWMVVSALAIMGASYLWLRASAWRSRLAQLRETPPAELLQRHALSLALLLLLAAGLALRGLMVANLVAPAWVDSIHHALFTRLILEQGQYPATYAPLLDIATASYHPGFHTGLAVFQFINSLPLVDGLQLYAQVLNALALAAVYLFTVHLTGNKTAGVAAALLSGFFTPMPAYYASWGRYTQLAGLLILPAAYALLRDGLPGSYPRRVLAAIACAGLFLTHYRVLVFLALLLVAEGVLQLLQGLRKGQLRPSLLRLLMDVGLPGLLAILFTLPWWPAALSGLFIPKLAWGEAQVAPFNDFSWGYLTSGAGIYPLALSGLGLLWGLVQKKRFPLALALWTGLLFLSANLGVWSLPGAGFINNTSVEISLFLPLAAAAAYPLGWAYDGWRAWLPPERRSWARWLAAAGMVAAVLFGAPKLAPILNPTTFLARQADLQAMPEIEKLVPAGQEVLINPFAWGYGLYAGRDGGYWISPLAGRPTLPPPVLYGLAEDPQVIARVEAGARAVLDHGRDPEALSSWMASAGVEYVYAGQRGGALSPAALAASPLFETLYARNGVWLFHRLP